MRESKGLALRDLTRESKGHVRAYSYLAATQFTSTTASLYASAADFSSRGIAFAQASHYSFQMLAACLLLVNLGQDAAVPDPCLPHVTILLHARWNESKPSRRRNGGCEVGLRRRDGG